MFKFLLWVLFSFSCFTPSLTAKSLLEIDRAIEASLVKHKVPGASVAIVVGGEVVLVKGYGKRDLKQDLPVTEKTLFAIGSCTKAFTTFVLGQLVDEGKLSWDDCVIKHIPEFRLMSPYATHHLTIRDLATHQSGLPRHDNLWYNTNLSRDELMTRLKDLPPSSSLREKFQYNNLMYMVAGVVIERVTGQSWEEAVQSRILTPLGMSQSNFSVHDMQLSDDFSQPYETHQIPFKDNCNIGPAGSMNSSAVEMAEWVKLQLNGDEELIAKATLEKMQTQHVPLSSLSSEREGYGLGWFVGSYKGIPTVYHEGIIDGFFSQVLLLKEQKIGIIILTNSEDRGGNLVSYLTNTILNSLLMLE